MPRINLLPWREEQRKERKLAFIVALGGATIAAGVATFAVYLLFSSMIDAQERRNGLLRAEIAKLDKQIEEINNLETAKQMFIARMEVIERLQRSRPEIVHLFDEITRTVPEGVYLTAVTQTDRRLKFEGVAQSSTRVSTFMRNIDGSQWLDKPELEIIETRSGNSGAGAGGNNAGNNVVGSRFTLYAEQVDPTAEEQQAGDAAGRVAAARGEAAQ